MALRRTRLQSSFQTPPRFPRLLPVVLRLRRAGARMTVNRHSPAPRSAGSGWKRSGSQGAPAQEARAPRASPCPAEPARETPVTEPQWRRRGESAPGLCLLRGPARAHPAPPRAAVPAREVWVLGTRPHSPTHPPRRGPPAHATLGALPPRRAQFGAARARLSPHSRWPVPAAACGRGQIPTIEAATPARIPAPAFPGPRPRPPGPASEALRRRRLTPPPVSARRGASRPGFSDRKSGGGA